MRIHLDSPGELPYGVAPSGWVTKPMSAGKSGNLRSAVGSCWRGSWVFFRARQRSRTGHSCTGLRLPRQSSRVL